MSARACVRTLRHEREKREETSVVRREKREERREEVHVIDEREE